MCSPRSKEDFTNIAVTQPINALAFPPIYQFSIIKCTCTTLCYHINRREWKGVTVQVQHVTSFKDGESRFLATREIFNSNMWVEVWLLKKFLDPWSCFKVLSRKLMRVAGNRFEVRCVSKQTKHIQVRAYHKEQRVCAQLPSYANHWDFVLDWNSRGMQELFP